MASRDATLRLPGARLEPGAVAILVVVLLVLVRSYVPLAYEQFSFNSDTAVMGLAAKHLSELRAFPLFQYAQPYTLAVESWLTAPIMWLGGASVLTLRLPLLALNVGAALLLVSLLIRATGLPSAVALLPGLFIAIPPPTTSVLLLEPLGGNVEPLIYVLLLWLWRNRPVLFGLTLGIGFLNREFVLYGLSALLLIELADGSLLDAANLRRKLVSLLIVAGVVDAVRALEPWTHVFGPGTLIPVQLTAGSNLDKLAGFVCPDATPSRIAANLWTVASYNLPHLLGLPRLALGNVGVTSTTSQGTAWLGPILLAAGLLMGGRLLALRWRGRLAPPPAHATERSDGSRLCWFLMLVGLQAAAVFGASRCDTPSLYTLRYMLLGLFLPVGALGLFLHLDRSTAGRVVAAAVMLLWAGASTAAHVATIREYLWRTPPNPYRELANYLSASHFRYGRADYWTAYIVDFLADERVVLSAEGFVRIAEYDSLADEHAAEAVRVSSHPCPGAAGVRVAKWYVCGPPDPGELR